MVRLFFSLIPGVWGGNILLPLLHLLPFFSHFYLINITGITQLYTYKRTITSAASHSQFSIGTKCALLYIGGQNRETVTK